MDRLAIMNNHIQSIHDAYKICADKFHEVYAREFDNWICTCNFGANNKALKYNHDMFNNFVDMAIAYRLGYTNTPPLLESVIDNLSTTIGGDVYVTPLSKVLDELVRGVIPEALVYDLYNKFQIYKIPDNIINHVVNKLNNTSE